MGAHCVAVTHSLSLLAASLVPALGAPIGYYVATQAKAEVVAGHRTILLAAITCAALIAFFVTDAFSSSLVAVVCSLALAGILIRFVQRTPPVAGAVLVALPVGVALTWTALPIIASLAFVLLFSLGSLCEQHKELRKSITYGVLYAVTVVALFFVS